jgi:hypothetical protein
MQKDREAGSCQGNAGDVYEIGRVENSALLHHSSGHDHGTSLARKSQLWRTIIKVSFSTGSKSGRSFFHRCNWRTFHFAHFEMEDDKILGAIETTLILLGLGFQVRWNYKTTEFAAHLRQLHDDVKSGKEPTYPLSEIDNQGQ